MMQMTAHEVVDMLSVDVYCISANILNFAAVSVKHQEVISFDLHMVEPTG